MTCNTFKTGEQAFPRYQVERTNHSDKPSPRQACSTANANCIRASCAKATFGNYWNSTIGWQRPFGPTHVRIRPRNQRASPTVSCGRPSRMECFRQRDAFPCQRVWRPHQHSSRGRRTSIETKTWEPLSRDPCGWRDANDECDQETPTTERPRRMIRHQHTDRQSRTNSQAWEQQCLVRTLHEMRK